MAPTKAAGALQCCAPAAAPGGPARAGCRSRHHQLRHQRQQRAYCWAAAAPARLHNPAAGGPGTAAPAAAAPVAAGISGGAHYSCPSGARPRPLLTPSARAAADQQQLALPPLPPVVNWHLEERCNYNCHFCFATFEDVAARGDVVRDREQLMQVPRMLRDAGALRISFVGGEPFMHPLIEQLMCEAKAVGLATSVVTNGSLLNEARLLRLVGKLDWIAFSVDASSDELHGAMGRGIDREVRPRPGAAAPVEEPVASCGSISSSSSAASASARGNGDGADAGGGSSSGGSSAAGLEWVPQAVQVVPDAPGQRPPASAAAAAAQAVASAAAGAAAAPRAPNRHLQRVLRLWAAARELGFRLKLNTVVCRTNLHDNLAPLVWQLQPERWKVFQVLPVEGQNNGAVDHLLISAEEFRDYVDRQRAALRHLAQQQQQQQPEGSTGSGGVAPAGAAPSPAAASSAAAAAAATPAASSAAVAAEELLVAESNTEMRGSYAMLDASCRFFTNASGGHVYGPSILQVGVHVAWQAIQEGRGFSAERFVTRGGLYDWGQTPEQMQQQGEWARQLQQQAAAPSDAGEPA